jgi:hypothetical protein
LRGTLIYDEGRISTREGFGRQAVRAGARTAAPA